MCFVFILVCLVRLSLGCTLLWHARLHLSVIVLFLLLRVSFHHLVVVTPDASVDGMGGEKPRESENGMIH